MAIKIRVEKKSFLVGVHREVDVRNLELTGPRGAWTETLRTELEQDAFVAGVKAGAALAAGLYAVEVSEE